MAGGRFAVVGLVLIAILAAAAPAHAETFRVNTTADPTPAKCTKGNCTLREAIRTANRRDSNDTVLLRSGKTYELELDGEDEDVARLGDLDITEPLTVKATGKQHATIDANGVDRVFDVFKRATFDRLTITGGEISNGVGVGLRAQSAPATIKRSLFTGNVAPTGNTYGGGFWLAGGGSVDRAVVEGNSANAEVGGGLVAGTAERPLEVTRSRFIDNDAGVVGGVSISGGAKVSNSKILSNESRECGGAKMSGGSLVDSEVSGNTVTGNASTAYGGGVCTFSGGRIVRSEIAANTADGDGGGINMFGGGPIIDSTITLNQSGAKGGGVSMIFSDYEITGSTISGNTAAANGGGLRSGSASVEVTSSTVALNQGAIGGGIAADTQPTGSDPARVTLRYSTVSQNSASSSGGGIGSVAPGSFESLGTIYSNNSGTSPDCGAAVTSDGRNLITNSTGCPGLSAPTDLVDVSASLMPLDDYGGPTLTAKPMATSLAIDAGGNACPKLDQRGIKRPKGEACDIGAVEAK